MIDEKGYDWRSVPGYRKQRDDVRDELERLVRERTGGRLTLSFGGEA